MDHLFVRRRLLIGLASVATAVAAAPLVVSHAVAAVRGRFRLNRRTVDEDEGSWRLIASIRLAAPAPSASLALHLDWRQHVDFEGQGDQQKRRAVSPPRLVTLDKDVDFSDPQGKVGAEARAELVLKRDGQFRAGDWTLDMRGPDGPIGARVQVTLRGNNPPA